MRLKVLEKTTTSILFEAYGERHSFANLLRNILLEDKNIVDVAYFIRHPELDPPRIFLQTKGNVSPTKVLRAAAKSMKKNLNDFQTQFRTAIAEFTKNTSH